MILIHLQESYDKENMGSYKWLVVEQANKQHQVCDLLIKTTTMFTR